MSESEKLLLKRVKRLEKLLKDREIYYEKSKERIAEQIEKICKQRITEKINERIRRLKDSGEFECCIEELEKIKEAIAW